MAARCKGGADPATFVAPEVEMPVTQSVPVKSSGLQASARERELELRVAELELRATELAQQRELLEAQVRSLHRVKTMADLLAGTAHDMTSALTGIVWASEALRRRMAGYDPDLDTGIADFVSTAQYARKLARRLISIGLYNEVDAAPFHVREVVEQSLELLEALQPPNVSVQTHLGDPNTRVMGYAEQFQQVVINLVTNAYDAMRDGGGSLTVELAAIASDSDPGRTLLKLTIADTGPGMTDAVVARAFEPFFTTKHGREGNGLGLSVVRGIVERHAGRIELASEVGVGTRVDIFLPVL